MSQIKPNKMKFMEKQVYKVVAPMLAVCYAMHCDAGGTLTPEEFAESVRTFLKADDLSEDFKKHLKDYSDYMQKGN